MVRGRYKIVRKIADGGMAEIFLGSQHGVEGFERPVVLKRILAALLVDPKFRNVLIDEAHVAMSLNHSNIAQVLDLGAARGRYYLVLEFVDGWDLNQVMSRAKAAGVDVPLELALYILAEVCRALAYAHNKMRNGKPLGIVHRDVSPHNVLLSDQGEVKLTDFGIAKAMVRREKTGQGVIKGKLAFMSPEQASGVPVDARSDLFAVGTILYLFATGRRPFDAPTDLEGILRVQRAEFLPPERVKSDLHPDLVGIIKRAMQLRPSERFQSADDMLVAIEQLQRSAFQPAGQTELKRWLSDLEARDGVASIGRMRLAPLPAYEDIPELGEGDFALEDASIDETLAAPDKQTPPAPAVRPTALASAPGDQAGKDEASVPIAVRAEAPTLPVPLSGTSNTTGTTRANRPSGQTGSRILDVTLAPQPPHIARKAILAVLALGALGAVVMRVTRHATQAPGPPPVPPLPPPDALPVRNTHAAARPPDAGPPAADARVVTADDDDNEEEALLRRAEPTTAETVIGDKEPDPVRTRATKRNAPPKPAPVVSVRIISQPEGAVIRLKTRVFGRAPMSLRFKSGITYELSFVKRGYVTAVKTLTPSERDKQLLRVTLKKRPAPKKRGLFQRLFGR